MAKTFLALIVLFVSFNLVFAQGWFLNDGMSGLEVQGIHYSDNLEEALGGEAGYSWNSRFDFKIKYLIGENDYQGQILNGSRFIPRIDWYPFQYPSALPIITSIFAEYHQESFTHPQMGTSYKLTGNGWAAGAKVYIDIFKGEQLRFMPVLEYRFLSIKRNLRQEPADLDLGTTSSHHFNLSIIMGKKFFSALGVYMEPGIYIGSEKPGYQIKLGVILPFVEESNE